jgi:3-(3-hydroxy-phenyl)propionate hydroxylase
MTDPRQLTFAHTRSADQDRPRPAHHPVVIVGAGPVGLVAAIDLAKRGRRSVVIDPRTTLSFGSKAVCWSKRTLEIMDRLGFAQRLLDKGVTWKRGRVLRGERQIYEFDLLPETGNRMPAFVNLQQYYVEHYCVEAALQTGLVDIRWQEEVTGLEANAGGVLLDVATPAGDYRIAADWVIAADGARSTLRRLMDLGFEGRIFQHQFLICDIKIRMDRPAERLFWFDPPFNRGLSALLHKQADDVWRLDFQVGDEADREAEVRPENAARRVRAALGDDVDFSFEWISLYRFQSRRLQRFRHGRVLFAGDAAHQMSPFGARGGNSGVQDADNLGWKLDLVLRGLAPERLLDSYDIERVFAADENLLNTTRSTDFLAPKAGASEVFRDSVLALAETEPFARRLVNSGRLSVATCYDGSPLNSADGVVEGECPQARPGAAALDAPLGNGWLLHALSPGFTGVWFSPEGKVPADVARILAGLAGGGTPVAPLVITEAAACARYGAVGEPAFYLFRPDGHIAARWRQPSLTAVEGALARNLGRI